MRTTLTIDDDVMQAAVERARREKRTVGAVLSDLARASLTGSGRESSVDREDGFPVLPRRDGLVTNDLVDRIRDEMGDY